MAFVPLFDVAAPGLLLSLGVILFILVVLLIIVIESTLLQLLRWGNFKSCLKGALWMNVASSLLGLVLILFIPQFGRWMLVAAWSLSVIIEALVLNRLKPESKRLNWIGSTLANTASYLIVIVPATG